MRVNNLLANLNLALKHQDAAWGYFHCLSRDEKQLMDKLLVAINHPLVMQPATNWERFQALHREHYQFS